MTTPSISVLMPVYNAERYVAEAVESILAQTFTDFEFLIIDDGSTDGSLAILQKYASQDPRIRLKSRPNTGLVVALNEMLADARGEYIARMDADDVSLPHRFQLQADALRSNESLALIGGAAYLIDAFGNKVCRRFELTDHQAIDDAHINAPGACICHPTLMARKEALRRLGGYRTAYPKAEDLDLFLRCAELGRIGNVSEVVLNYRLHVNSVSRSHAALQQAQALEAINSARTRRGMAPLASAPPSAITNSSPHELMRDCGWMALSAGNIADSRRISLRLLAANPWRLCNWRLFACAVRGR